MSELRTNYMESFLTGLSVYAHITATAAQKEEEPPYITISQHLTMDGIPLIIALAAPPDTFHALASGYSGISLSGMDDLAVDAACELFNVINGHFSSQMRAHGSAVSIIDPPRHVLGSTVPTAPLFHLPITCPSGTMQLMASREEFLP